MTSLSITMSHRLFSWSPAKPLCSPPDCSITESCCHRQQLGPCDACTRPFIFNLLKHQGTKETKSQDANESYVFCVSFLFYSNIRSTAKMLMHRAANINPCCQNRQGLHLAFIIDGNMVMLYMCFVFITLNHITILPLI